MLQRPRVISSEGGGHSPQRVFRQQHLMVLWRRRDLHPPPGGSGTGSRLLHYFSTNRVDSRGLRWIPVDSTAADKRLTSNVLDHKLRVFSQLPKHARTGSTPAASNTSKPFTVNGLLSSLPCACTRVVPIWQVGGNPPPSPIPRPTDLVDRRYCLHILQASVSVPMMTGKQRKTLTAVFRDPVSGTIE